MKSALLCAILAMLAAMPADARIKRSTAAKHAFMAANPCPSDKPHKKYSCPGWVVDHRIALACGGRDQPDNMSWQTISESKAKDKWERKGCGK